MDQPDEIKELLREIRDLQREQLAEYRQVTRQSLQMQQRAVERQEQIGRLYKPVMVVTLLVLMGMIVLFCYLLVKLRLL